MKEKTKIFQGIIEVDCPHWHSNFTMCVHVLQYLQHWWY